MSELSTESEEETMLYFGPKGTTVQVIPRGRRKKKKEEHGAGHCVISF